MKDGISKRVLVTVLAVTLSVNTSLYGFDLCNNFIMSVVSFSAILLREYYLYRADQTRACQNNNPQLPAMANQQANMALWNQAKEYDKKATKWNKRFMLLGVLIGVKLIFCHCEASGCSFFRTGKIL